MDGDSTPPSESSGGPLLRVELPLHEFLRSQDSALAQQVRRLAELTAEPSENYAAFNNAP